MTIDDILDLSIGNERQTKTWLKAGMGTFWTFRNGRYFLAGLGALCASLGVIPYKSPVDIPRTALESLQTFRALLYSSWFTGAPKTVSQKLLSQIFGRSIRTLWAWGEIAKEYGFSVRENIVWARLPKADPRDDIDPFRRFPPGAAKAMGIDDGDEAYNKACITFWLECWKQFPYSKGWTYEKGDRAVLVRQFANTYHSAMSNGPVTTLQRRARKAVKRKRKRTPQALGSNPARANVKGRVVFSRPRMTNDREVNAIRRKKWAQGIDKSLQKNGFAYVEGVAYHHGRKTWEFCVV
jgi:hypothetical protein